MERKVIQKLIIIKNLLKANRFQYIMRTNVHVDDADVIIKMDSLKKSLNGS